MGVKNDITPEMKRSMRQTQRFIHCFNVTMVVLWVAFAIGVIVANHYGWFDRILFR